jgi:ABC-type Co2+ transport system permease subunit
MMELTDTTLLNLTTRFATKQNNITLTTTGTSGASTLVGSTLNIPQYTGGSGTVTSVGSGYGLLGGPITTTGTLTVDTSTVYDFVRDSIVAVEIGGDTIKIL